MKKIVFAIALVLAASTVFSQDDEYQKFIQAQKKQMEQQQKDYQQGVKDKQKEYKDFVDKQNAEFAEFVAKDWALFNEFAKEQLALTGPKIEKAPVAKKNNENANIVSKEIFYTSDEELPKVTHAIAVAYDSNNETNNYEQRSRIGANGAVDLPTKNFDKSKKFKIDNSSNIMLNFYGREVMIHVDSKLKIKSADVEEKNVAEYFSNIAKCRKETKELWDEIDKVVKDFFWFDLKGEKLEKGTYVRFIFKCDGQNVKVTVNGEEMEVKPVEGKENTYLAKLTKLGAVAILFDKEKE